MVQAPPQSGQKQAIQVTTLSEAVCRRWISQLLTGRGAGGVKGRFSALHDAIAERDKAFHALKPPVFSPPFDKMQTFQSDALRRAHQELMVRITEHPIRVKVTPPRATIPQRLAAEALAVVLETGLELVQEREGNSLLAMLGDGMLRHAYGVLHWYKRSDVIQQYPDPDELDALPTDTGEAARYRATNPEDRVGANPVKGHYRETEASVKARDQQARAVAGFPYAIEVLRADQGAFVPDKRAKNGIGLFISMVTVGRLDYDLGARKEGFVLSVNEANPKISIYEEQARPEAGEPSADDDAWGTPMRVAHLWTPDECYELGAWEHGEFSLLRSWAHDYGMPPFALAKANELNEPDPLYRYQPFLLGIYRTKPDEDYERSLGRALAEQTAVPRYWIELAPGEYWMDAAGNRIVLTEDAASAQVLPAGAKLVKADMSVDPAFIAFLQMSRQDRIEATPPTGFVDVGVATAPHTLNMSLEQANAPIAQLKLQMAFAIRIMLRNIAEKESRSGESLVVMAKVKRGAIQQGTVVEVLAKDIPGLDIDVAINPNSGAQEIAAAEYWRTQLADPQVPFGPRDYLEKTGVENGEERINSWIAQKAEFAALDHLVQQELAHRFGDSFVLMPGGGVIGWDGSAVDPMAVLGSQGIKQPPQPTAAAGSPATRPLGPLQPLAPLQPGGDGRGAVVA